MMMMMSYDLGFGLGFCALGLGVREIDELGMVGVVLGFRASVGLRFMCLMRPEFGSLNQGMARLDGTRRP